MSARVNNQHIPLQRGGGPAVGRRAFTLIELLITVTAIAIVMAVVIPSGSASDRSRVVAAATMLASDVEYSQSLAISTPGDPILLRVATNGLGYWIARSSAPDTPVERPNVGGRPYVVVYGQGVARQLEGVQITRVAPAASDIEFDEFGRLTGGVSGELRVEAGSRSLRVLVSASTGAASIVD